ncbi:MAG: carbohydrate ABC transporter permease [Lachnospiraceae bacterium]|nr:carbohydrate ABC transporter permease [Lachnospiraceae bacterium]MCI9095273.1 carbohydrate ABC transporter permease [Lachnospiraceae bacterium]MCI9203393.1 carbohydrate ABC transporter permease [Lachnospiraceae bacterium]MCI9333544.1 carbohydrate ABC transporter permease [Lachnospiraceae bacterium]
MRKKMKMGTGDRIFYVVTRVLLAVFLVIVLYPIYFVVIASFSDSAYVNSGEFLFYPKGFTLLGYSQIFKTTRIWISYMNTLIYVVFGTMLGLAASVLAGYSLSQKKLLGRNVIMGLLVFTMYFGGGLIPTYLVIKGIHLTNTRLLLVIMGSISVYNIILIRSFFAGTLPQELQDAAFIDGCGNGQYFFRIALPLSKAILSVIGLYIAVAHWNSYFNALIYVTDRAKQPLQLYLREVLLMAQSTSDLMESDPQAAALLNRMVEVIKYGIIVVSTVPIICVYPFLQKYFVKGVMIGSVKG